MARLYVLDYPFAMKYVWILVAVVFLVRIDVVLRFFENTADKISTTSSPQIKPVEVVPNDDLIGVKEDVVIKSNPRRAFMNLMEDFRINPEKSVMERALEVLKSNPNLFSEKLDEDLEAVIYRWRNLVIQRNKETSDFLMELQSLLKGENLEMVKRFYSLAIDTDLEDFLKRYSKSKDTNCLIISYLADPLPEEEKFNELNERLIELEAFLKSEKDPALKSFAQRCHLVLKMNVDKLKATLPPEEDMGAAEDGFVPQPSPSPEPDPSPSPEPTPGPPPAPPVTP